MRPQPILLKLGAEEWRLRPRDHPEAAQKLSDVEATAKEIGVAMADVLRLGGFIAAENAPGEAMAGSTSISSTPA
ncbi:MAG: hypothetical protein WBZ39_00930 [Methylovirgula sp.]